MTGLGIDYFLLFIHLTDFNPYNFRDQYAFSYQYFFCFKYLADFCQKRRVLKLELLGSSRFPLVSIGSWNCGLVGQFN